MPKRSWSLSRISIQYSTTPQLLNMTHKAPRGKPRAVKTEFRHSPTRVCPKQLWRGSPSGKGHVWTGPISTAHLIHQWPASFQPDGPTVTGTPGKWIISKSDSLAKSLLRTIEPAHHFSSPQAQMLTERAKGTFYETIKKIGRIIICRRRKGVKGSGAPVKWPLALCLAGKATSSRWNNGLTLMPMSDGIIRRLL